MISMRIQARGDRRASRAGHRLVIIQVVLRVFAIAQDCRYRHNALVLIVGQRHKHVDGPRLVLRKGKLRGHTEDQKKQDKAEGKAARLRRRSPDRQPTGHTPSRNCHTIGA